jgi:hypothetical protein
MNVFIESQILDSYGNDDVGILNNEPSTRATKEYAGNTLSLYDLLILADDKRQNARIRRKKKIRNFRMN